MDYLHLGFLSEEFLVGLLHGGQDMRIHIGLPTAVAAAELDTHAGHGEAALERNGLIHFHTL